MTPPPTRTESASPRAGTGTRRALLWLESLLAVGAYAGAVGLITGGVDLGAAADDLPFGSLAFGGWALLVVNGVLPTVVVIGALARRPWATPGHLAVGLALIGWIVVQVGVLGWPPNGLQILYFGWGWAILGLAITHRRAQAGLARRG